jgi:transposase
MTDKDLYSTILGVSLPWQVTDVTLDIEKATVTVHLDYDARASSDSFTCPICGAATRVYDRREERLWRHLDSCQFQTFLAACLPRICCPTHGILTASVFWAEPNSRFTLLFEAFAIRVLQATGVQSRAAQLLHLSPGQVHDLMGRAVERGLKRRDEAQNREGATPLEHLSVDEKSHKSGHQYISVLSDPLEKRVLEVVESRTQQAVEELFSSVIAQEQRSCVLSVSMDMWPAFLKAREQIFPQADTVHDRYHIAAYLGEALDKTRRSEHRTLTRQHDATLNKTKYLWLRSEANLTEKQKAALDALTSLDLETAKVWAFKESFRQFFACTTKEQAQRFFQNWLESVLALGNVHLTKVAQMLSRHLAGLLAYVKHRVSNATAESLNALIQQIKSNAKGFRKWESFRIAILFFLGKLDLQPHKTP